MLKEFLDFERDPTLLAEFEEVAGCYSASCVFSDVQYRTGVMHSSIKAAFPAKAVGQALTVQLSKGDLVDPLKALEMGRPGDLIVVDAGGDTRPGATKSAQRWLLPPRPPCEPPDPGQGRPETFAFLPSSSRSRSPAPDDASARRGEGRYPRLVLNGFHNHYAVPTNFRALSSFHTTCSGTGSAVCGGGASGTEDDADRGALAARPETAASLSRPGSTSWPEAGAPCVSQVWR